MPDMGLITELLSKLGPNASMADIMKLVPKDPSKLGPLADQLKGLRKPAPNLDTFEYAALTPGKQWESFWVIQLGHLGNNGPDHQPGTKPVFMVYCYDNMGSNRITQEVTGLPNAKMMLDILKRAIAAPLAPLKPALPWRLCVSLKLKPQFSSPDIKTFLDGLPKPFHWRSETAEERDSLADGVDDKNRQESEISLETAAQKKSEGNAAFGKMDRQGSCYQGLQRCYRMCSRCAWSERGGKDYKSNTGDLAC